MGKQTDYEGRHRRRLSAVARRIDEIFAAAAAEAGRLGASLPPVDPDAALDFGKLSPALRRRVDELVRDLASDVQITVEQGVADAEALSAAKCEALVAQAVRERRLKGQKGFSSPSVGPDGNSTPDGRTRISRLSNSVWKLSEDFRAEMEMGIDIGLRDGLDAGQLGRRLKRYLQNPEALYRRVRDEHGILHLSKRAGMYHPGRGVYRSAAKNARRLAVTEVNAAYRKADAERWGALDFVVGVEVRTSGNHTCLGSDGKPHPFRDICDELAGRYPKDFVFSGWHPQCRCHAVPILKTPEEMEADGRRIMAGEEPIPPEESENAVTQMPEEFRAWEEANADRLERARAKGTLPWFYRENRSVIDGKPAASAAPAAKAKAEAAASTENGGSDEEKSPLTPQKGENPTENGVSDAGNGDKDRIEESAKQVRKVAETIVKNGYHSSRESQIVPLRIGSIPPEVIEYAANNSIEFDSNDIYITTKGIEHTLRENKISKGIAISIQELVDFVENKNHYTIYYDREEGDLIFVTATAKFIVRPNFKLKINKEKVSVFNYISATRIRGNLCDNVGGWIKIKDAKQ